MAKKINITDKLNFDSNPVIVIGAQAYEYLSAIYLYFDGYGSYFFSGRCGEDLQDGKRRKEAFSKFPDDYYSVCHGFSNGRKRGRTVTRTMI